MGIIVRPITKVEVPHLVKLCEEHAQYEGTAYNPSGKAALLSEYLFDRDPSLACLGIFKDGDLVGYASLFKQFSTWDAGYYMYLDCLYLNEASRGQGIGSMVMKEIKGMAISEQCALQWQTPDFNTKAIAFYEGLGTVHKTKERFFWNL